MELEDFKKTIWNYYSKHKRIFPWRETTNPYYIFISEVMLQQTQAPRVVSKYLEFINRFPDFKTLAESSTTDVLKLWQGLGYNRRALALQRSAQIITQQYQGNLPKTIEELDALPGIGYATACSISSFAFNEPVVFIETNIRTVFIHFFFSDRTEVTDRELLPFIESTLDRSNSRDWYYALMDYGTMLKKSVGNANVQSKHYSKQSVFKGSMRELRGKILKILIERKTISDADLIVLTDERSERLNLVTTALEKEGFIRRDGSFIRLI